MTQTLSKALFIALLVVAGCGDNTENSNDTMVPVSDGGTATSDATSQSDGAASSDVTADAPNGPPPTCNVADYAQLASLGTVDCYAIGDGQVTLTLLTISDQGIVKHVTLGDLVDHRTGEVLDLSQSPLFSIVLFKSTAQQQFSEVTAKNGTYVDVSSAQTSVSATALTADVTLTGLSASGAQLDVTLSFSVAGGAVHFDISAELKQGADFIQSVKAPIIAVEQLGGQRAQERLLMPFLQGSLVTDPIANAARNDSNRVDFAGNGTHELSYPADMFAQLMAYYDQGSGRGLYLAATDENGHYKRLNALGAGGSRLILYQRHYNQSVSTAKAAALAELKTFSLSQRLGYDVVFTPFKGDWIDAADIYRAWLDATQPKFYQNTSLADRDSQGDPWVRLALHMFVAEDAVGTTSLPQDFAAAGAMGTRLNQQLEYLRGGQGQMRIAIEHSSMYSALGGSKAVKSSGNDIAPNPPRPGVATYLAQIAGGSNFNLNLVNRDTGSWGVSTSTANGVTTADFQKRGAVLREDGSLNFRMGQGNADPNDDAYFSCYASKWLSDRNKDNIRQNIADAKYTAAGKSRSLDFISMSGQGSASKPCYANLADDTVAADHQHVAGHSAVLGYVQTVADLIAETRTRSDIDVPHFMIGNERRHEQLLHFIPRGHNEVAPVAYTAWEFPANWERVPAFERIYHDRVSSLGFKPSGLTELATLYGQSSDAAVFANYERAHHAIVFGETVGFSVALSSSNTEFFTNGTALNTSVDGTIADSWLLNQIDPIHAFARDLALMRHRYIAYLGLGRWLRPPEVTAPFLDISFHSKFNKTLPPKTGSQLGISAVTVGAYSHGTDNQRAVIVLANPDIKQVSVQSLELDAAALGLPGGTYGVTLVSGNNQQSLGALSTSLNVGPLALGPGEIIVIEIAP